VPARRKAAAAVPKSGAAKLGALVELRGALLRGGSAAGSLRRDDSEIAREFLRKPTALRDAARGAFTPDQIVFCGTVPLLLRRGLSGSSRGGAAVVERAVQAYTKRHGRDPRVVIVPGEGVYYTAPDLPQLEVVAQVYRGAMAALLRSPKAGGPRWLSRPQARFVEGWEGSRHHAAVARGQQGRLSGRLAAVTGAASGLGKGIATGLIEAGATVFGLDLNAAMLEETAAGLPSGKYVPVEADVTSEESIAAAFAGIERSAGGLDYLVNAAGIAPSFSLVDFPLGAWQKTLDINLTGYFLCAREAARLLLRQGTGGAMVNLTSKSGLEASKQNSAYNATKAGEIHLMRGWALELGSADIRVNCVAPGNVFKGSQIWSPEYIRTCAKKKGIRPEEVIPYYTSLAPLGKEIEPSDIANAVVFLVSEEARNITGQTLVVDGGQVSVR